MVKHIRNSLMELIVLLAVVIGGCGGEASVSDADPEANEDVLTVEESAAIEESYALEALETIDENNAESELEKLTAEIEADK
ncbi:MAG: hypothetical protein JXR76_01325 [Deltaproteobacteria bacterium]|nr:hypothetical protein [Deltaproteobacteria bacterium]